MANTRIEEMRRLLTELEALIHGGFVQVAPRSYTSDVEDDLCRGRLEREVMLYLLSLRGWLEEVALLAEPERVDN